MRWGARCALLSLLCAPLCAIAQNTAGHSDNRTVNADMVRQAHVNPRTVTLPVVDGKGIRFTRLSTEDGLSQTKVSQIVQDDQGFMWFGSQYGLSRYDGYKFKVFKHEPGRTNSLSGVLIYSPVQRPFRLALDWMTMNSWTNSIQLSETFTHYRIDTHSGAKGETVPVTQISQDHLGYVVAVNQQGEPAIDLIPMQLTDRFATVTI